MYIVQSPTQPALIRHALSDLLHDETDDVKVASAYVTNAGTELLFDALRRQIGQPALNHLPKVLVTSFDFGLTDPVALDVWRRLPNSQVRVAGARAVLAGSLSPATAFHPKLYLFGYGKEHTGSFVGSANLTGRGLSINTEVGWLERDVPRVEADTAFAAASAGTVALTDELLAAYSELRRRRPPPPDVAREIEPVPRPRAIEPGGLELFRDAVEHGLVIPTDFGQFWVHVEKLQGGSGNQLELPRGAHRFFGFHFSNYEHPDKVTIGVPILIAGSHSWHDRLLTWHGNNRMERLNLPTVAQGGFSYDDSAVMFRRREGGFELVVSRWDSDLARSWREASAASNLMYRLGQNTGRVAGFI